MSGHAAVSVYGRLTGDPRAIGNCTARSSPSKGSASPRFAPWTAAGRAWVTRCL